MIIRIAMADGEVRDGRDAVKLALEQSPDLVLMDMSMPGMIGIEATRRITMERPRVKVLCLSLHAEWHFVQAALDAGASGYLLKEMTVADLLKAIRTVMRGQIYLSPGIEDKIARAHPVAPSGARAWRGSALTCREREILQLIAEAFTNLEIAERLHVSSKTVSTHRQKIMDKLNIHNAVGLTKYAIRHGLTSAETSWKESVNPGQSF